MKKLLLIALLAIGVTAQAQTTVPQKVYVTGGSFTGTQTVSIANTPTNVNVTTTVSSMPSVTITASTATTVQVIAASTTATVNLNSSAFGSNYHKWIGVQFLATSLSHSDGVIKLQDSNDGTNWNDVSGASITVASGTTSNMIRYTAFTGANLRAVWTKGSNTAGTISAIAILKQ